MAEDSCALRALAPDVDPISLNHFTSQHLGRFFFFLHKKASTFLEKTTPFSAGLQEQVKFFSAYVTSKPFMFKILSQEQHVSITWMAGKSTWSFWLLSHLRAVVSRPPVEGISHSFCSYKNCHISKYRMQSAACHLHWKKYWDSSLLNSLVLVSEPISDRIKIFHPS